MLRTLLRISFKNIVSRKSSAVIVAFISFAVALLSVTNAVFDSTEKGVRESFSASFTGDVVVRPKSFVSLSLFGDETPITGEFTSIPILERFSEIEERARNMRFFSSCVPQLSGRVLMEFFPDGGNAARFPVHLFGVEFARYFSVMDSLSVVEGALPTSGEKGIAISDSVAAKFGCGVGDIVQFSVADGFSFRIRAVPVVAVYSYPSAGGESVLSKIALVDDGTLRELLAVGAGTEPSDAGSPQEDENAGDAFDFETIFDGAEDFFVEESSEEDVPPVEMQQEESEIPESDGGTWHFLVIKLSDSSKAYSAIANLNSFFRHNGISAEAVGWRQAAGSTAFYLYILRLVLNAGIIIILVAGLIVVNNTLVVNVLDRTREIGTMRAIGASRNYIRAECFFETGMLASSAGVFGLVLGTLICALVNSAGISFENDFLIQLFGSGSLVTEISAGTAFYSFAFAFFLGAVAWIHPSAVVLRIRLVDAMTSAK